MSLRISKIYIPKKGIPMSVVFFASNSEVNLKCLCDLANKYPKLLSIDLVVTDRGEIGALKYAKRHNIPTITQDFKKMCGNYVAMRSPILKKQYNRCSIRFHNLLLKKIKEFERKRKRKFDLAVLSYYRWIHGDLLRYFNKRMINQHPADLTVLQKGKVIRRKYIGIDPVYLSIKDNKKRTRTSTILVRTGHDAGEILCQGPWCTYKGPHPVTITSAARHERIQEKVSDIPALWYAVEAIAKGFYGISNKRHKDHTHVLYYKGEKLPYGGVNLSRGRKIV